MNRCKGINCGCTDGVSHSLECHAEHAASIAGGVFVKSEQPAASKPEPQAQAGEPETFDTSNMDAMHWAKAFASRFTVWSQQHGVESDTAGLMLGWFANAIMAGYDEASRRNSEAIAKKDAALKACVEALKTYDMIDPQARSAIAQGKEAME